MLSLSCCGSFHLKYALKKSLSISRNSCIDYGKGVFLWRIYLPWCTNRFLWNAALWYEIISLLKIRRYIQSCSIHCIIFIILNVLNSNFLVTSESYYQIYYSPCKRHVLKLFILAQVRFQGNNNNINRFRLSYNEFCYPYWKNMQSIFWNVMFFSI